MRLIMCTVFATIAAHSCGYALAETDENDVLNCWESAGEMYGVDPWLLYAIAEQESSLNPAATNINTDGSEDVGLMQISSWWLAPQRMGKFGVTREALFDHCLSINLGAWIVAHNYSIYGQNWEAIGAYNAGTGKSEKADKARRKYATSVRAIYERNLGGM